MPLVYFNTSHVTVYHLFCSSLFPVIYFNTSHVTVYQKIFIHIKSVADFNTSHVTVYHTRKPSEMLLTGISIHLMLLFILGHTPQS